MHSSILKSPTRDCRAFLFVTVFFCNGIDCNSVSRVWTFILKKLGLSLKSNNVQGKNNCFSSDLLMKMSEKSLSQAGLKKDQSGKQGFVVATI